MSDVRPKLAQAIWSGVPVTGRYEADIVNTLLGGWSRHEIDKALKWLVERGHLRRCGDAVRPLYARPERSIRYDNIRPLHGMTAALLAMHSNFTEDRR